jgi:Relaxase/Mobilisation nuclease domain
MHTKMKTTRSYGHGLSYHLRKIQQDRAKLLYAGNMLKDAEHLTLKDKRFFFDLYQSLNRRIKRRALHIIISWPKADTLTDENMRKITKDYMKKMGLENQPYLVFRHQDALHDHVHILTPRVRHNGQRIDVGRTMKYRSLQVSRELEKQYGLYQAGRRMPDDEWARLHPVQKLQYGVTPLKPTINALLDAVIPVYKYTSLAELNAILQPYKVKAVLGNENTATRRRNGLLFIPTEGWDKGTYIKASKFRSKPTLKHLQERFTINHALREEYRQRLTAAIDWIFYKQTPSMEALRQALQKENISIMNDEGKIFYIDRLAKTVWDSKALGQKYTAQGLKQRCIPDEIYKLQVQNQKQHLRQKPRQDLY